MNLNPQLNLVIQPSGDNFDLVAFPIDGRAMSIRLPIDRFGLHQFNNKIKDTFLKIVGRSIYNESVDIPESICVEDLRALAELEIFDNIFLGDDPTDAAQHCISEIKRVSRQGPQNIQIIAKKFWIPWTFLYDGDIDAQNGNINRNAFWGFKHIIDTPPVVETDFKLASNIDSSKIVFGLNVNERIDTVFKLNCVKDHKEFFQKIQEPNFNLKLRSKASELLEVFKSNKSFEDSIAYFYCHAESTSKIGSSPDDIYLELTDNNSELSLFTLRNSTRNVTFINEPLVFINACESMVMDPLFYDGFVTYFINKKARGIVGTISKVPAIFGSRFGLQFFSRFFAGSPVGSILSELRKEFLLKNNNLLGLFYMAYCYAQVQLNTPLYINKKL
jgi:hypothetical protein